jgi:phosphoglycolate phosphatase
MMPSVLLYDWDNTLVDGWSRLNAAMNAALAACGRPCWTVEETRRRLRTNAEESWRATFGEEWRRARHLFHAAMSGAAQMQVQAMPGADELLAAAGARTQAVVSNKDGRYVRAEAAHLGWEKYFRLVIGAGEAAADKPFPAPILLALSRMDTAASPSVWYVGDTAVDMRAARAAGVTSVLLGDAAHDPEAVAEGPDLHFTTACALAAHLRALD